MISAPITTVSPSAPSPSQSEGRASGRASGAAFCVVAFLLPAKHANAVARRFTAVIRRFVRTRDRVVRHGDRVELTLDGASAAVAGRRARTLKAALPSRCRLPFVILHPKAGAIEARVRECDARLGRAEPWWKRPLDVAGAAGALVLTAPVMLVAAALVKATSRGPVLYSQWRAGKNGVPFRFVKFRTMIDGADRMQAALHHRNEMTGPLFKLVNDPRVTRVGRWLRRTSIDELPQLWNVLRGDMSLVGPRPATLDEVARYEPWHHERLSVRQGLTAIWQVEGRGRVGFPDSARMDIRYCRERSLRGDLRLLWRTFGAVLGRRGAH